MTNVLKRLRKDGRLQEEFPDGEDAKFSLVLEEAAAETETTSPEAEIPVEDEQPMKEEVGGTIRSSNSTAHPWQGAAGA